MVTNCKLLRIRIKGRVFRLGVSALCTCKVWNAGVRLCDS